MSNLCALHRKFPKTSGKMCADKILTLRYNIAEKEGGYCVVSL